MMISDRYMVNERQMVSVRYIVNVVEYMVRAGDMVIVEHNSCVCKAIGVYMITV